jgi:periplasmic protein TonB
MLDQLVESKSGPGDGARRSGFLLITLIAVFAVFFGSIVWSLFDGNRLAIEGGDLELSNLVAPVPVPEEEPPPPEPEKPKEIKEAAPNADVRKVIIQDINESPQVPDKISTEKQIIPPRRMDVKTVVGDTNSDAEKPVSRDYEGPVSTNNKGIGTPGAKPASDGDDEPPPPAKTPTPKPTPPPVPKVVSGGVVNGKAVNLVKPPYPPAAKAVRASGQVQVQVTIDENGNVISASAVSGHALLRGAAESAARSSKFSPTLLSGQKVKVTGVIIYNFAAQ